MVRQPYQRGFLSRLRGDQRGMSAVEFALIAPFMVAFYFGLSEFCQGFMAQKRMGHVSATVADLVTQNDSIDDTEMQDIFSVGPLIMNPFVTTSLRQRVTHLTMDDNGVVKVDWGQGYNGFSPLTAGATVAVPAGLIEEGESVVMAEVTYDYDSPVDYLMPGLTRFEHTYYLRPRRVDQVEWDN